MRHETTDNLDVGPEKLGLDFLLDGSQNSSKVSSSGSAQDSPYHCRFRESSIPNNHRPGSVQQTVSQSTLDLPFYAIPIRNGPATCPLDTILLDFLHERQKLLANTSPQQIIGPAYPSFSSLLNPSPHSHPLSRVIIDILSTFPDLSTVSLSFIQDLQIAREAIGVSKLSVEEHD